MAVDGQVNGPAQAVVLEQFENADFAFAGEAELGLPLLIQHLRSPGEVNLEEIPGLIYRVNGKITANSTQAVKLLEDAMNVNLRAPGYEDFR